MVDPLGVEELAAGIVDQAVKDWRALIRDNKTVSGNKGLVISFNELRRFFKSAWCKLLIDTDPLIILAQLEKELATARKQGVFL